MKRAIFLDRDGVLNVDRGYVCRPEDFEFLPGAIAALQSFDAVGYELIVVTNQSGIGRGLYTADDFRDVTLWMLATLAEQGILIAGVYHCPHTPEEGCQCRKPAPGMIRQAAQDRKIDLKASWLIGDKDSDIEAAHRAGVGSTILIRSVHASTAPAGPTPASPTAADTAPAVKPLYVCHSLFDTVRIILADDP